jgi:hypothetical protein
VLDAIAALQATIATYGTMALQNANAVAITGGTINGTVIGGATPAAGTFTTLGVTTSINAVGTDPDVNLLINSKGTGSTIFNSDNGEHLRIFDRGLASVVNYAQISGATNTNAPRISGQGSGTNVPLFIGTKGTSQIAFYTNNFNQEQMRVSHTASAVNYVQVTGSTTGNLPGISAQGSDASVSLAYSAKGVASHRFQTNGGEILRVSQFGSTAPVNRTEIFGGTSGFGALVQSGGTDTNVNLEFGTKAAGLFSFKTNTPSNGTGAEQLRIAHTASAVNYVQVTGAATGGAPTISAQGSDANANLILVAKGGNSVVLQTRGGGTQRTSFLANDSGSNSVNFLQATSHNAGSAPILSAQGTDTNIDLALTPKGTGKVRFGTYTADMTLIVQGFIEVKDSGGTIRKLAVIA